MLNVTITPHREFLAADTPGQKLFVILTVYLMSYYLFKSIDYRFYQQA